MADIIYTFENNVYFNLTNKCTCSCIFCIRKGHDGLGDAETLWHDHTPSWEEIEDALEHFDFTGYKEAVFCGYGEPTCAYDNMILTAKYMKEHYPDIQLRLNTNGLGEIYNKKPIVEELAQYIHTVSISLNAPDSVRYSEVTRPCYPDAFQTMLGFAKKAKEAFPCVKFSVVDVISEEEIEACQKLADELGIPLRVRTFV